ncbi:putative ribonuclease H-like domain-containing protein [Tanacetum coccineum]|uniref:Ribonuclease H-like domain-containing protein n=1 Tax=Tanacetum coccineum TaxID=301880 RepID=A0ABQ4YNB2_9ASTR
MLKFSWVFFLATKNETSEILKTFITGIENLIDLKVKVIRYDNGTGFKNRVMNQFCEMKGRKPALSFMRPFGCPVKTLNTIDHLGTKACDDAGKARVETIPGTDYILLPLWTQDPSFSSSPKRNESEALRKDSKVSSTEEPIEDQRVNQKKDYNVNSTNTINTVSPTVNAASIDDNAVDENIVYGCADDLNMPALEEDSIFGYNNPIFDYSNDDEDVAV